MIQIEARHLRKLLCDPVMAAEVLMGWKLDTFQAAALRMDWWFPYTIDSSGVSTGKTLRVFILLCLRCMLMPDHVAAVYFPNFQTGKDEFWPYFAKTLEQSAIFREQCLLSRKVVGELKEPGAWSWRFKNGSRIIMPAPSFMTDAATSASRRFNTLVVDDWLKAMEMGDGVDKQLIDRVTRPNFNKDHPIWGNHIHLKGHADRPGHKAHRRLRGFERLIERGSTKYAIYSFCFRDYSEEKAKKLRPDSTIQMQRESLTADAFRRQWLGIWTRDGSTFYPEAVLHIATQEYLKPVMRRVYPDEVNILGFDVAPGQGIKSDSSAASVLRIVPWFKGFPLPVTFEHRGNAYNIGFTFASIFGNRSSGETAAFIHYLHRIFAFAEIVLDPGGGGLWVYKDLKKEEQEMDGRRFNVTPLCTPQEAVIIGKQPIVHFFKRGAKFDELTKCEPPIIEPQFLAGDEGLIQAFHDLFRQGWEVPRFHWPMPEVERDPVDFSRWDPQLQHAQKFLDESLLQLTNVVQDSNEQGQPLMTKRGFNTFSARGKKDGAMAAFYAYAGSQLYFHAEEEESRGEMEEAGFACV